ncbi:MAG: hypothetical protein ALECFALPRED_005403 [Alectoria fallacina]|uniref:Uncharacterized protein n=1 Tax=Alectoria fallacina TaxID=1903189 RepID=A0A8H3IUK1_9LECA|nr:MAG: hypothetical protein ALECFALPRED_005403 [Alectoria fallacina]
MSLSSKSAPSPRLDQRPGKLNLLRDLQIELIPKTFDHISQILALNSTSRVFCQIWRLNSGHISRAILPRSIAFYDATGEIQEAEESASRNWIIGLRFDPPKTLETLVQAGLATSPVSSNKAAYATALARYMRLVSIGHTAEMISRWCKAYASKTGPTLATLPNTRSIYELLSPAARVETDCLESLWI